MYIPIAFRMQFTDRDRIRMRRKSEILTLGTFIESSFKGKAYPDGNPDGNNLNYR